jgi:hypothetical protein
MTSSAPWEFEEGELPTWARPIESVAAQTRYVVPGPTLPGIVTILGQMFLFRLLVNGAFLLLVWLGRDWVNEGNVGRYALIAAIAGFPLGSIGYVRATFRRLEQDRLVRLGHRVVLSQPSLFTSFVVIPAVGPLFVLAAATVYFVFANRYTGIILLAAICAYCFYRWAKAPIRFAIEKLSTDHVVSTSDQEMWLRSEQEPDWRPLVICLLVVFLIPAYFSTTLGIAVLVGYVATQLVKRFRSLRRFGSWRLVVAAILMRAQKVGHDFYAYFPMDAAHWTPPLSLGRRRLVLGALLATTDLVLLVGLTFFIPWELFASLSVPGFDFPVSAIAHYPTYDFTWLTVPSQLVQLAEPREVYLASTVIAMPLFVLLPPAVLLLAYFPRLIELENIDQEIKRRWKA